MNTKKVSDMLNISLKTLRLYEDNGIVVAKRDSNNYRNYDEEDIKKLRRAKLLRDLGIPLKNVKEILDKKFEDNKIIRELNVQLKVVQNRISELESINKSLIESINDALVTEEDNSNKYFDNLGKIIDINIENRKSWIDKWNFDNWAKNYDLSVKNNYTDELKLFEKYDFVLEYIIGKIKEYKAKKVLDIGCGTCNLYGRLDEGIKFTGIDQSIEMLLASKSKYSDICLRLGNFLDEPFVEDEFEVITSTYAFHHLNALEKERAINYMLKYLKQSGRILIADLMFENEKERINKRNSLINSGRNDLWEIIDDEYYGDVEKLKSYCELLGCEVKYKHIVNFTWVIEITKC